MGLLETIFYFRRGAMKKITYLLLTLVALSPRIQCRHDGGAVVAGALGGLAVGTMIGSASAQSERNSRVEDRLDQEQRERDQEKVRDLERKLEKKEMERKIEEQRLLAEQREKERASTMHIIFISLIFILGLALAGLGIAIILKKKH
ncbi:MAG: Protein Map7d2 [candidate division TM6 bacterium GW2011_GWF2_37_49]|nr:MAG: Protein Map7d2 [candidate division TM6 bacterium GW2011_GWF2_37_49]